LNQTYCSPKSSNDGIKRIDDDDDDAVAGDDVQLFLTKILLLSSISEDCSI
jgi:hypothetical protein